MSIQDQNFLRWVLETHNDNVKQDVNLASDFYFETWSWLL